MGNNIINTHIYRASVLLISLCIVGCSHQPTPSYGGQGPAKISDTVRGQASYYANKYQGRTTASGEKFDQRKMTAAHKQWPFGTRVRVTNLANGQSVVVVVNDRGPFIRGRVIDLSSAAFKKIADPKLGVIEVRLERFVE